MITPPAQLLDKVVVGNDAAWIAEFYAVDANGKPTSARPATFGRDDYYASVEASMPEGLAGGRYRIVIEGLTDEHYGEIAGKQKPYLKLYLFWRDANRSVAGYLANVAGVSDVLTGVSNRPDESTLVAVLGITSIGRRRGAQTYDVEIEAREWVFDRLHGARLDEHDTATTETDKRFVPYMTALVERKGVPATGKEFPGATHIVGGQERDCAVLEVLSNIANRLVEESRKGGRSVFLIRDGRLLIGERDFELPDRHINELTYARGLIEITAMADWVNEAAGSTRQQFQVLLKGRPDIKPGSVVKIVPPPLEERNTRSGPLGIVGELATDLVRSVASATLVDSLSAFDDRAAVTLYVMGVTHQLGKSTSFSTTLVGVVFDPTDPWDTIRPTATGNNSAASATGEERLAQAIDARAQSALNQRCDADVGQVRAQTTSGAPRHTVAVWRGTSPNGASHAAVRLPFERGTASRFEGVPVVTPFAWGKTGLIVPRYPGMRVVMVHRNGELSDALDIGAVWEWEGNTGPDAEPGDYWLMLPAAVPEARRASIDDNDSPQSYTGAVTQDLIDADGHRIIEVGELVIRIGDLKDAGTRPLRPADAEKNSVLIEHVEGKARILMDQNGTITIKGKNIQIDASDGTITMKAKNVDVEVGTAMNVKQG